MINIKRSHLIAATAAPLVVVLIATVLVVTRDRSPAPAQPVPEPEAAPEKKAKGRTKIAAPKRSASEGTKTLAVSADGFDPINTSLDELGAGYGYAIIDDEALLDPAALGRFQVLFLTCAGTDAGEPPASLPKVLHDYVSGGGTLYASDLRYDTLTLAFPEVVDPASVAQGVPQDVRGEVTSPELRDVLGPEIALHFKSERWRPAAFRGDEVSIFLKGELKTTAGVSIDAPLAVRFPVGKGTVIFTSFHSEGRVSDDEAKLLRFLALKAVTSGPEVRLTDSLADAGFSTRAVAAAAADAGEHPEYHVYEHEKPGPLRFRLEPARPGAVLSLEVVDPAGKTTTKKGDSTVAIDLTDAAPGRWQYRARAETAPYPSFPAVMVVGTAGGGTDSTTTKMNPALVERGGNVRFEEINLGNKNVVKEARPLRIAVTEPMFDNMGKLLDALGDGYRYTQLEDAQLITPNAFDRFDVVFLTCGGWPAVWGTTTNKAFRPGLASGTMRPDIREKLNRNLNRFVGRGGTLYASDLRYEYLAYAFPERIPGPDLDPKRLPDIDKAEHEWLKVVAPTAEVGTVSKTLDKLSLSEKLLAQRDELLAVINTSILVKIDKKIGDMDDLQAIRAELEASGLTATEDDCKTIADAFSRRRMAIANSIQSRNRSKINRMLGEIGRADHTLNELRARLQINYSGAAKQFVDAEIVDSGLQESIGDTIRLRFPDNSWEPGRFTGDDVQVLMRGTYVSVNNEQIEAPLLVKFRQGKGTVIFTSFHNEAQNSQQELQLLRYLVFSAVTAKEEALAQETMLAGGFSPVKQGQVNHAIGMDSITKKYQSTTADPLRFSLNFGGDGAILQLTLVAPGGQEYKKETDETILVEATGAAPGEWLYTVTAVKVPYKNYAYSVSIGRGAPPAGGRKR
jgi:hypothetical protein